MANLVRTLLDLTRDLFETNPPAAELAMGSGPSGDWRGGLGGAAAAVISARKSEWVAHKVAELAELARCMVLAGYSRYPVSISSTSVCGGGGEVIYYIFESFLYDEVCVEDIHDLYLYRCCVEVLSGIPPTTLTLHANRP